MQPQDSSKKRLVIIGVIAGVVLIGLVILLAFLFRDTGRNQYGERIRIQNYEEMVENTSSEMRDAKESYLYNIVKLNTDKDFDATTIKDAYIREGSAKQNYAQRDRYYSGSFIVDMESIKQSYWVQYTYALDESNPNVSGSPVVISCLPEDQLKYGPFDCKDLVSEQSAANDVLLQYLPYQNFSFRISPDATRGERLTMIVRLSIPQLQLKGSAETRRQAVAQYKEQVESWIISKGADPASYDYEYNYDDNGNPINLPPQGSDED